MSAYFQTLATTPLDIKRSSHRVSCGSNSGKKYYLSSSEGCSQTYSDLRERLMHIADKKKKKKKKKSKTKNYLACMRRPAISNLCHQCNNNSNNNNSNSNDNNHHHHHHHFYYIKHTFRVGLARI